MGKGSEVYDRKSEIYQNVLGLFIKKGYDATPMSIVANVLVMSKVEAFLEIMKMEYSNFETLHISIGGTEDVG
jgi:hypothetical protein